MKIVIAGGSGFLGKHLAQEFKADEVIILTRSPKDPGEIFWDGQTLGPWTSALEGADAIVNLAGKSISSKMTEENKREMLTSRTQASTVLGKAIASATTPPKGWINANAMGYYGDRGDETLTEDSPPGAGFLSEVSQAWEEPLWSAKTPQTRKVSLRIGFVLGADGGGLPTLVKFTKAFLGGSLGSGRQWLSWIHIDDLARLVRWCIETPATGPYNAVAPNPARNSEFAATLRSILHRPWSPPAPALVLRALGKFMAPDPSLGLISARVLPAKAQAEGFIFHHPALRPALEDLLTPNPMSDQDLWRALDQSIQTALNECRYGDINTNRFVEHATQLDPQLYAEKSIRNKLLSDLWNLADEYFDAFTHGFPDFHGKTWEQARRDFEAEWRKVRAAMESTEPSV